jgi:tetratricopeptide (TPR) repeat protein
LNIFLAKLKSIGSFLTQLKIKHIIITLLVTGILLFIYFELKSNYIPIHFTNVPDDFKNQNHIYDGKMIENNVSAELHKLISSIKSNKRNIVLNDSNSFTIGNDPDSLFLNNREALIPPDNRYSIYSQEYSQKVPDVIITVKEVKISINQLINYFQRNGFFQRIIGYKCCFIEGTIIWSKEKNNWICVISYFQKGNKANNKNVEIQWEDISTCKEIAEYILKFYDPITLMYCYVIERNYEKLNNLCVELINIGICETDSHFMLGNLSLKNNNLDLAIRHYQAVIKKEPRDSFTHMNLGLALVNKGLYDEGIKQYKKAIKLNPKLESAHYNLAIEYHKSGKNNESIQEYEKVLEINPLNSEAHFNLAYSYNLINQKEKAIQQYQLAIYYRPDYANAHHNLGILYYHNNEKDLAEKEYKLAIKYKPISPKVYLNLGKIYEDRGQLDKAKENYIIAISYQSNYALAHNNLGVIYMKQKLYSEAQKEFNLAIKYMPDYAEAYNNIAETYAIERKKEEAIAAYQLFLKYYTKDDSVRQIALKNIEILNKNINAIIMLK